MAESPKSHIAFLLTVQAWNERRLFLRQAPALAEAGHRVSVICVDPDLNAPMPENMKFVPLAASERKKTRRTLCRNIRPVIQKVQPDVLVITCMEQLNLGFWVKKKLPNVRVVFDCREDHSSSVRYHKPSIPKLLRPLFGKYISYLEDKGDQVFDALVTSDPSICEHHPKMPEDRRMIFYNVPQKSLFAGTFPPYAERKFDLAILGSMSLRVGVDNVVEAMGRIKVEHGESLSLLLIGRPLDSELKKAIEDLVAKYDMSGQIHESGYIDHREIPATLSQARIGLSPHLNMRKFRHNIACKCFEYMACEMPVVCSDLPPQRLFINDSENGFFYPPGNVSALSDLLIRLKRDQAMAEKVGQQGRRDFEEHWNCENEIGKLVEFYDRVVERAPR